MPPRLATATSQETIACDAAGDYFLNCPQTMAYSLEATEVAVDGGVAPIPFAGKNCLVGQFLLESASDQKFLLLNF